MGSCLTKAPAGRKAPPDSKDSTTPDQLLQTIVSPGGEKYCRPTSDHAEDGPPMLQTSSGKLGVHLFRKLKLLGRGAVGRVYLVEFVEANELYAMKVLSKEETINRDKLKRVFTERQILMTVDHPFIVTLYASFDDAWYLYFVMEYCSGGEFFRLLKRQPGKRLPESDARFYAAEVLLALEYLHKHGFIYRDLKPENILISADGHIRLTDFDLARAAPTPESEGSAINSDFRAHSVVGTLEYLAPEMLEGRGHGHSVDWWTFGVLLYEMLFGVTPFFAKSQWEIYPKLKACVVTFPPQVQISSECRDLLSRLLVKERRLGSVHGAADIKAHPFFKGIDWSTLPHQTPPIVPPPVNVEELRKAAPIQVHNVHIWETEEHANTAFSGFPWERRRGGMKRRGSAPDLLSVADAHDDYSRTI